MNDNDTPCTAGTATDEVAASRPASDVPVPLLPKVPKVPIVPKVSKVQQAPPARAPADAFPLDATGWGTCGWPWM